MSQIATSCVDRFALGVVARTRATRSGLFDGPIVVGRGDGSAIWFFHVSSVATGSDRTFVRTARAKRLTAASHKAVNSGILASSFTSAVVERIGSTTCVRAAHGRGCCGQAGGIDGSVEDEPPRCDGTDRARSCSGRRRVDQSPVWERDPRGTSPPLSGRRRQRFCVSRSGKGS
jgi:hypothetical protein